MKIKDDFELANVLGMAFEQYANKVANGATAPFKAFIDGAESVDVTVTLNSNGSISVTPKFIDFKEPEPPVLEEKPQETVTEEKPKRKRKTE